MIKSIVENSKDFLRLVYFGGPIILWFMVMGLIKIYQKNKTLLLFIVTWLVVWAGGIVVAKSSNPNHFLEILFPIILLASFGIYWLAKLIINSDQNQTTKKVIIALLMVGIVGHLMIANKWMFHEEYNTTMMGETLAEVDLVNKANLSDTDVIAYGGHPVSLFYINYYADKNIVQFDPQTINDLLGNNQLQDAFDIYQITHILGYGQDLTNEIRSKAKIVRVD